MDRYNPNAISLPTRRIAAGAALIGLFGGVVLTANHYEGRLNKGERQVIDCTVDKALDTPLGDPVVDANSARAELSASLTRNLHVLAEECGISTLPELNGAGYSRIMQEISEQVEAATSDPADYGF